MIALYTTALSMFVAIVLVPLLARVARPLGLLDQPGPRKIHSHAVPRVGGIAIVVGAIVSVFVWVPLQSEIVAYAIGSLIIFLFGLLDDRLYLDYRWKLVGQVAGAVVFVAVSDVYISRMPFMFDGEMSPWIGLPLTVVAIVGITNAVNMSDGMDGLAGGTSLLATGALGYLTYLGGDKQVTMLALAVLGATLGFLRYNTHPARVFMGDAGSQFLGFSVATLALMLVEHSNTAVSPLIPLLLLALPIIDTSQVIVTRLRAGRSPFVPDRCHLHHRLLDAGLNQYQAVLVIYGLQIVLVGLAWWLIYAEDWVVAAVFVAFAVALLSIVTTWQSRGQQGRPLFSTLQLMDTAIEYLREHGVAGRVGSQGVTYGVALLFLVLPLLTAEVGREVGWAVLLLMTSGLLWWLPWAGARAAGRLTAFGLSVTLVYLAQTYGLRYGMPTWSLHASLIGIAGFVGLWLRFGSGREFHLNTLDVLVIFIVAVVPNLPVVRAAGLGPVVIEALMLFYACEMVLDERPKAWELFRSAAMIGLVVLAARGL
jgi:UDP-GlcNAc:undecaprenyl-phosphate/decaprenyl-phosphate GlcNAc-1-phosphate transferase